MEFGFYCPLLLGQMHNYCSRTTLQKVQRTAKSTTTVQHNLLCLVLVANWRSASNSIKNTRETILAIHSNPNPDPNVTYWQIADLPLKLKFFYAYHLQKNTLPDIIFKTTNSVESINLFATISSHFVTHKTKKEQKGMLVMATSLLPIKMTLRHQRTVCTLTNSLNQQSAVL